MISPIRPQKLSTNVPMISTETDFFNFTRVRCFVLEIYTIKIAKRKVQKLYFQVLKYSNEALKSFSHELLDELIKWGNIVTNIHIDDQDQSERIHIIKAF